MGRAWPALDIHVPGCDPQLLDLVLVEIDDFQPTALEDSDESSRVRAFFTTPQSRDAAARALASSFGSHLFVESVDIEDEDWAARSQAQLRAITIGRIIVAPPWDTGPGSLPTQAVESAPVARIVIRPSMGFGTGHHATTRLMLKALQELPIAGRTALDVGCGSGVLAMAAVALGAAAAVGIDIDPDALANAADNLELNDLSERVRFEEGDFLERASPADVVLANLTGGLLERAAPRLAALVEPSGHLVVSGFMESESESVMSALDRLLTRTEIDHEGDWVCAVFVRRGLSPVSQISPDVA